MWILGDAAFGSIPNIRTTTSTIRDPLTDQEIRSFKTQRVTCENAFGLFKGKFRLFGSRMVNGHTRKSISIIISGFSFTIL